MSRKIGLSLKIDVTKIDKSKLFHGKDGAKYLDLTTFINIDEEGQYGDNGFITQSQSKEERDSGVKSQILGNNKIFYTDGLNIESPSNQAPTKSPQQQEPPVGAFDDSDIPF